MRRYTIEVNGKSFTIDVQEIAIDRFRVLVEGQEIEVGLSHHHDLAEASITPEFIPTRPEGLPAPYHPPPPETLRQLPATPAKPLPPKPTLPSDGFNATLQAPMPGVIIEVGVAAGAQVAQGQEVCVLEAMKMKNTIRAPQAGVVAEVLVQPGQTVAYGEPLIRFEDSPS